ncbi:hypothetical protein PENTCL1PPCAC_30809, partial [Pristionchus entomophagus]
VQYTWEYTDFGLFWKLHQRKSRWRSWKGSGLLLVCWFFCWSSLISLSDVSIWLYQAQLGFSPDSPSPHVHLLVRRLSKLIFYKIRPVFVFDGPAVPAFKHRVLEERAMRRHADEMVMNKETMKHLEDLAKNEHEPAAAMQKALAALRSPQKGRRRDEEERMFQLPCISREVVNLADSSEGEEPEEEEEVEGNEEEVEGERPR